MPKFGAHISISGGFDRAVRTGAELDCRTIQVFVKNANSWRGRAILDDEIERFLAARKEYDIEPVVAHTSFLINLAGIEKEKYEKSMLSFLDELDRCRRLKIPYLVLHPGAHRGLGEEAGLIRIGDSINRTFAEEGKSDVTLLLETTAGQGSYLGYTFEQLALLIKKIRRKKRIGVCYDTQHTFAAGYDIRSPLAYKATFSEFDRVVGLKYLKVFHLNDSKMPYGSRRDRHDHIGNGKIGLEGFRMLVNDKRFADTPMILETPKGPDYAEDVENLKILRGLLK